MHLIRDSRAVAYSWARSKERPEVVEPSGPHAPVEPGGPVSRLESAELFYSLLSRFANLSRLRYEDFVSDPAFYLGDTLTELASRTRPAV